MNDSARTDPEEPEPSAEPEGKIDRPSPKASKAEVSAPRPGRGLSWLALLLALAAGILATRDLWFPLAGWDGEDAVSTSVAADLEALRSRISDLERRSTDRTDALIARLDAVKAEVAREDPTLATIRQNLETLEQEVGALGRRLNGFEQSRNVDSGAMRERLDAIETELGQRLEAFSLRLEDFDDGLDDSAQGLVVRLRLQEIDRLLAAAQDAMEVSADAETAARAWRRANDSMRALDGLRFETLKQSAAEEQAKIEQWQPPDRAADVRRLYEIADGLPQWSKAPSASDDASAQGPGGHESEGWRDRLGQVLDRLVTVENREQEFVNPARVDARVRQRVQELEAAAAALGRGDHETVVVLAHRVAEQMLFLPSAESAPVQSAAGWLRSLNPDRWNASPPQLERTRAALASLLEALP